MLERLVRRRSDAQAALPPDAPVILLIYDDQDEAVLLADMLARVAGWLDEQSALDGRAIAVTHAGVVKAAVVHALSAPAAAFWRLDATPLAVTELHAHDGRWTVARVNGACR